MNFKNVIRKGNITAAIIMVTVVFTYVQLVIKPQSVYAPIAANYVEKLFGAGESEVCIASVLP